MKLNYAITLTAADSNKRTIAGTIVLGARKAEQVLVAQYFKKTALISASLLNYY